MLMCVHRAKQPWPPSPPRPAVLAIEHTKMQDETDARSLAAVADGAAPYLTGAAAIRELERSMALCHPASSAFTGSSTRS